MKSFSKTLFAVSLALAGSFAAAEASIALPLAPRSQVSAISPVQHIGWRCGPGWHVNGWGRCVPNRPRGYWRRW